MTLDAQTYAACYDALQLPPGSSPQQIRAQYRRLAKAWHPDRNPQRREWSEEHLRRLNEAYHVLTHAQAAPPPPFTGADAAPPSAPAHGVPSSLRPPAAPERPARLPTPRRALRYAALVGVVCAASVAYSNWPQSPQMMPAPTSRAPAPFSPPALSSAASPPQPSPLSAASPAPPSQASLEARFAASAANVDYSLARASQIVSRVNAALQHAPQSRRPQRAEQLAADALELRRLQHSVRAALEDMPAAASPDLQRTQIADVQLALFQMARQQHLVNAEVAAFPVK